MVWSCMGRVGCEWHQDGRAACFRHAPPSSSHGPDVLHGAHWARHPCKWQYHRAPSPYLYVGWGWICLYLSCVWICMLTFLAGTPNTPRSAINDVSDMEHMLVEEVQLCNDSAALREEKHPVPLISDDVEHDNVDNALRSSHVARWDLMWLLVLCNAVPINPGCRIDPDVDVKPRAERQTLEMTCLSI